jgi:GNAT superfamily N-acetyltransferase
MTGERVYPDEPAGRFDRPPLEFRDREDRSVVVRRLEDDADHESLVEMYVAFDPEDRAQGIPPTGEQRVRDWLGHILTEDCVNVVAEHEDGPGAGLVGHATLVPDGDDGYELAIFVLHEFQNAGIGTSLITGLLGAGQEEGIERVWLTVERWNNAAVALYRKVGFETSGTESFELEMALRLN